MQTLGQLLKESRVKAGLSQKDVSKVLGYSSSQFISNIERGIALPPIKDLGKLAASLKVDKDNLKKVFEDDYINRARTDVLKKLQSV